MFVEACPLMEVKWLKIDHGVMAWNMPVELDVGLAHYKE
jgi:hypothetical protein